MPEKKKDTKTKKPPILASLKINNPSEMSREERMKVARWLAFQRTHFMKYFSGMGKTYKPECRK